jgi:simple sugar transport system ATP-binding protein
MQDQVSDLSATADFASLHPGYEERAPIVELVGVTKRFPGVVANDRVDLAIYPGEVHVLLGENGAGKSTLVGMLSGLLRPDDGEIRIDGAARTIFSPRRALDLGIGTVFQHVMLVPSLSVAENVALGAPWWRRPNRAALARDIAATGERLGISLHPDAVTGALSLGEQQQAEIVRALMRGGRVLILDEATAMLTPKGAEELGGLMRRLAAQGVAVVFITHKLKEAFAYGDRITVLRLGRKVGEISPERLKAMDESAATAEIVRLMFGSHTLGGEAVPTDVARMERSGMRGLASGLGSPDYASLHPGYASAVQSSVLQVEGLLVHDASTDLAGVSLSIAAGEILGIAGIDGNGQRQLAEALAGQRPIAGGRILLEGTEIRHLDVGARRKLGLRYVTDDRLNEGTVAHFPIATNFLLKQIGEAPFWRHGIEQPAEISRHGRELMQAFDVRAPGAETPIGRLSGGNIQKALLARELSGPAKAVIYAKPTAGLDVQNILATRRRILEAARRGVATLLISTDLDELLELSDCIAVMSRGRIVGIVARGDDARHRVGEMMVGVAA